jgi:hypothetical protein
MGSNHMNQLGIFSYYSPEISGVKSGASAWQVKWLFSARAKQLEKFNGV